jgi:uncharacterized protein (DUF983 family)
MSVENNAAPDPVPTTDPTPAYTPSANYMPCEHCGEGTLVYDAELRASRCRACGEPSLPTEAAE